MRPRERKFTDAQICVEPNLKHNCYESCASIVGENRLYVGIGMKYMTKNGIFVANGILVQNNILVEEWNYRK